MTRTIRLFMLGEGAAFIGAAAVHFGILMRGYEHQKAGIAETVIGTVLLAGLAATWSRPQVARLAAVASQAFALFGTLVGILTIVIGVGPRTTADIVYHFVIIGVLLCGLVAAVRTYGTRTGA